MIIYLIENTINNKIYIGQTINSIEYRFDRHKSESKFKRHFSYLYNAMEKYGLDNFKISVIEDNIETQEDLDKAEIYWIRWYDSANRKIGYNISLGGNGPGKHSEESKLKMSKAHKGKIRSEDHKKSLSIANSKKRKPLSEETKNKISQSRKGKTFTQEHKNNISKSLKGKKLTDEHIKNISEAKTRKSGEV